MKTLQWFKKMIGTKVVVSHSIESTGMVHIADEQHAIYLHKTQGASGYAFHDPEGDDVFPPIVTGILIGELLADSGGSDETSVSDFGGFGGGSTDGAGAGGDWGGSDDSSSGGDDSSSLSDD